MEHIFNIAINVEDEKIQQSILERAETEVLKDIRKGVECMMFKHQFASGYYYGKYTEKTAEQMVDSRDGISSKFESILEEMFEQNKELIFEIAGKALAERLCRTKKAKELLEKIGESV